MFELLKIIVYLLILLSFLLVILGWRLEVVLKAILTKKKTPFPYAYVDHARDERGYEMVSNPNYWLLLAVISLLSEDEF
jgi:hypothetical protein